MHEPRPARAKQEPCATEVQGRSLVWHYTRVTLGITLCVVGVVGTLLPVIPGVPLIIAGVALLGTDHWLVRPVKQRIDRWRGL